MKLFGIGKTKPVEKALNSVDSTGWTQIFDWIPGAWQANAGYDTADSVLAYHAVFSCITLIAADIGKLTPGLQKLTAGGIWDDVTVPDVLKKPNPYQNHIQFKEWWLNSKLVHGNTYAMKVRSGRQITGLLLLDPTRVTPLVADNGDVFYRLNEDNLSRIDEAQLIVPASEIIHDRMNCIFHPLIGLSPVFASGTAATMGLSLQNNGKDFFGNGSNPGGILSAPGAISNETADRLKTHWDSAYTGTNSGKVAVVGDDLKYTPMRMSNIDAQMIEHMKWTALVACSTFHVPAYMVGIGDMPTHNNIEALTQQYYGQCLQTLIESMELALFEGLEIAEGHRVQLDLNGLFRMDTATQMETLGKGVAGSILAPNEARRQVNLKPLKGGNSVYLQQQNYSLEALAERDAENPLAVKPEAPAVDDDIEQMAHLAALVLKEELALGSA